MSAAHGETTRGAGNRLNRRDLLKWVGLGGAAAVGSTAVVGVGSFLFDKLFSGTDGTSTTDGGDTNGGVAPARANTALVVPTDQNYLREVAERPNAHQVLAGFFVGEEVPTAQVYETEEGPNAHWQGVNRNLDLGVSGVFPGFSHIEEFEQSLKRNPAYRALYTAPVVWQGPGDRIAVAYATGDESRVKLNVYTDPRTPSEASNGFSAVGATQEEVFRVAEGLFRAGVLGAQPIA